MKKSFLLSVFFSLTVFLSSPVNACTTAIVSGKATKDGRPLLLKNRDSDFIQNRLMFFNDGKYSYIGLVNSDDKIGEEVWGGFNSAGFAVMNSASYNLKGKDTTKLTDMEGRLMKTALQKCATIDEFEQLLKDLPKPLGVEANFGVIDANGGAAYFETNNFTYTKYDVNDPSVAPKGYLIRTNYSCSGEEAKGAGYIRFATESEVFRQRIKSEKYDYSFLINDITRCLKHSLTRTDLTKQLPQNYNDTKFVWFQDFIPRTSTTSAIIVQGIKTGESPTLTTLWSQIGFPLTSVTIPVWITKDGVLPGVLTASENGNAPLCELSLSLKSIIFPPYEGRGEKYMDISKLMNKSNTGIRQKLNKVEAEVIREGELNLKAFRKEGIKESMAKEYFKWVDRYIKENYKKLFNL